MNREITAAAVRTIDVQIELEKTENVLTEASVDAYVNKVTGFL